jgi:hypothetical protein
MPRPLPRHRTRRGRSTVPTRRALATLRALRALGGLLLAAGCAGGLPLVGRGDPEFWGFTAPWDPRSAESARLHGTALDAVVTGWFALDPRTGLPGDAFGDGGAGARQAGDGASTITAGRRMALVTTYADDEFHPAVVRALANDDAALARSAAAIAARAGAGGYDGLVIDFEGHDARDLPALAKVVRAIGDSARAHDVRPVVMAVPAGDTAAYPARAFLPGADLVLVMLYDEHWAGSGPGAIASPDWARRRLAVRASEIGAGRLVVSLPLFGYVWRAGGPTRVVSFAEARGLAGTAGDFLERDPASLTLRAADPGEWEVWVSDAALLRALIGDARRSGVRRFALWRLGLEDPAVWSDIGR